MRPSNKTHPAIIAPFDTLGFTLRKLRKAAGYTIPDMERMTGISAGSISNMENGKGNIGTKIVELYATHLKLTVNLIIAMDEQDMKRLVENNKE